MSEYVAIHSSLDLNQKKHYRYLLLAVAAIIKLDAGRSSNNEIIVKNNHT